MNIQSTYNEIAKDFSATRNHPWPEFEVFAQHILKNAKVLDIGCGNGRLYEFLKPYEVSYTGLDISEEQLKEAKRLHPEIQVFHDSMPELQCVKGQKFDIIFLIASFHHLSSKESRERTLERLKELLNPEGKICMTNWNLFQKKYRKYVWESFLQSFISAYSWNDTFIPFTRNGRTTKRYYHAFTPWELERLFRANDLKVVENFSLGAENQKTAWYKGKNICHVLEKSFVIPAKAGI